MLLVFTSRWNDAAYTAAGILLAGGPKT